MADAKITIKCSADVKKASEQLKALGYNIEDVKKTTDKANESASIWQKTLKKGSEDNINKIVEMGAKYLTLTTIMATAYKGVKSLVTEGLKVNTEASKQIDSINAAWTEVKANLGSALLDSITPALDTLLDKLNDISDWSKKVSGRSTIVQTFSDVQKGLSDWSSLSTEMLKEYSTDLEAHIKELGIWSHQKYQDMLDSINQEIERREELDEANDNLVSSTTSAASALKSIGYMRSSGDTLSDISAFLSSNSSYSSSYKSSTEKDTLLSIRHEAKRYQKALNNLSGDDDFWNGYDFSATEDNSVVASNFQSYLEEIVTSIDKLLTTTSEISSKTSPSQNAVMAQSYGEKYASNASSMDFGSYSLTKLEQMRKSATAYVEELSAAYADAEEADKSYYEKAIDSVQGYIDKIKEAQDAQVTMLNNAMTVASGIMDVWDNAAALKSRLLENEIEEIENSQASEEEKATKLDNLKRKQFESEKRNAMANAAISTASAILKAYETYMATPWLMWTMIGLAGVAGALQLGTISSQQYTGLADGGIVQSPTHALIGEGAEKEAVLPLSKLDDYINRDTGAGTIVINVTVNGGNGSNTAEDVYYAIERAQRTGLLPKWRYA